jgi:hypothetical protein
VDAAHVASPHLLGEVGQRYGPAGVPTVTRLSGGYANDVFRVDFPGPEPVVLHVSLGTPADASSLATVRSVP